MTRAMTPRAPARWRTPHDPSWAMGRPRVAGHGALPFRADLEGLRGVAILTVVAYHVGLPGFGGGFVGVDVFFALSGFLITSLLVGELTRTGTIDLPAFFARRIRRLAPSATVMLATTLAVTAWLDAPLRVSATAASVRAAAAFGSNLYFAAHSADYFGVGADTNPLLHSWSLSVEEQFYLVWPALVLVAAGRRLRVRRLLGVLLAVVALSLAASWWFTIAHRPTAFFGTPTRAWEFAVGALAALAAGRVRHGSAPAVGSVGLLLIAVAVVSFSERTPFPGVHALLPVLGTALVLVAGGRESAGSVGRALSARPLQWFGSHSYGWYLWHWPVLVTGTALVDSPTVVTKAALALAALVPAVATRAFVETPARRARWFAGAPSRTIACGLVVTAALVCGATLLDRAARRAADSPEQRAFTAAARDLPAPNRDGCSPDLVDSTVRVCRYGVRGAPSRVVLFGDSHAAHWFPALEPIARARGWELVVVTKSACPSVEVTLFEPVLGRAATECAAWRRAALDSVRAERPSLVILANSTEVVTGAPWREGRASVSPRDWELGLARTLAALRRAELPTVVIQDTPRAPHDVTECLRRAAWRGREARHCDFRVPDATHVAAANATRSAVAGRRDQWLIDLTPSICPRGTCAAVERGVIRYRDSRHLTAAGAAQLTAALQVEIDRIVTLRAGA